MGRLRTPCRATAGIAVLAGRTTSWILFLLTTLALRGAALGLLRAELARDPDGYRHTARLLIEEGVYAPDELASQTAGRPIPGAYRPPLYPLLLAAIGASSPERSWRVAVLQLALGLATAALSVALAGRWGLGRWAWAAGLLVAADPLLLVHSAQVMTETLAALLAVATLYAADGVWGALQRRTEQVTTWATLRCATATGVLAGLAVLCRPTFLPWAIGLPVLVAWFGWRPTRSAEGSWGGPASACLAGLVLVLAPWALRNGVSLGAPIVTTTHGGYTFYLANNREFFADLWGARATAWNAANFNERWRAERAAALGPGPWPQGTERAADRLAYRRGRAEIVADPEGFLRASGFRLTRFWGCMPEPLEAHESRARKLERWAVGAWYAVVLSSTALGLVCLGTAAIRPSNADRSAALRFTPALWLLVSFTLVHAVFWTNLRMRAPLMPAVAILSAAGARAIVSRKCLR